VVDAELDAMLDAHGLDGGHAHGVGIAMGKLAVEHVAHREDGLERVALRAPRRGDVGLAAGDPDGVIEDRLDGLGLDPARVVLDGDRPGSDGDGDHRSDLGLLAGVERVVHQLLEHHQRPIRVRMPGLVLQLLQRAELHQPRDPEGHSRQLVPGLPACGAIGLCHDR
jgi:hypothetical protein